MEGLIVGDDGKPLAKSLTAQVSVISVDDCSTIDCESLASNRAQRIVLGASGQLPWMLFVRLPGMPSDLIKVGDTYDLTVDAAMHPGFFPTLSQSVVLSRGGAIHLFVSMLNQLGPALPQLDASKIAIVAEGMLCETIGQPCNVKQYSARVTIGPESVVIARGHTERVADLSFTVASFDDLWGGFCDRQDKTQMGAFALSE